MPTVKEQIEEVRAKHRKKEIARFKEWLKERFGREPKAGDIIMLSDSFPHSISRVGGPYRVVGVNWDYSNAALTVTCPKDTDVPAFFETFEAAVDYGNNYEMDFARNRLKSARFAREDELDGSAFQWEVAVTTAIGRGRDQKEGRANYERQFDRLEDAVAHIKEFTDNWEGKSSTDWKTGRGVYDGFINLYDETGNDNGEHGYITRRRVRRPDHPFRTRKKK